MFLLIDRVGALCCVSLVVSLSYASDLKITERVTTRGFRTTSTRYISGLRSRYESRSATTFPAWPGGPLVFSYGHRVATIFGYVFGRVRPTEEIVKQLATAKAAA